MKICDVICLVHGFLKYVQNKRHETLMSLSEHQYIAKIW